MQSFLEKFQTQRDLLLFRIDGGSFDVQKLRHFCITAKSTESRSEKVLMRRKMSKMKEKRDNKSNFNVIDSKNNQTSVPNAEREIPILGSTIMPETR